MWIAGLVLIAISGVLFWFCRSQKRQLETLQSTQTSQVQMLEELAQSMREGVGQGTLSYLTEVKGQIACASPLKSELGGVECIYYAMEIRREYEETYRETDKNGQEVRRTRTVSETVAENERAVPFVVDDGTGQIRVEPEGAEFVAEKVLSHFEPASSQEGGELRLGNFSLRLPALGGGRRTLGYRSEEKAIPLGRQAYVLGEATDRQGALQIQKPAEGQFIVSLKGEEELVRQGQSAARWLLAGSLVCGALGAGLLIATLVKI